MSDLSDWAAAISAAAAAFGLFFVGAQTQEAARGTAVTITHTFVVRAGDLLHKFATAASKTPLDGPEIERVLQEFFAHFELFVIFIHEAPLKPKMLQMIDETILNFVEQFAANGYVDEVSALISKPADYRELRDFCKQRASAFQDFPAVQRMLKI